MNVDYNTETQELTVELNSPSITLDTPTGGRGLQGIQGIQGPQGEQGPTGQTGATGNGIASITKISSVDTTDTYRITFTDGTTYDYEITNGEVSQAQLDELQAQVDRYKMLENALPHITGTGTELTLDNTANAVMTIDLEPSELSQDEEPTPDNPQDIHVVSGDNTILIRGKQLFDGEIELGNINTSNGELINSTTRTRSKNFIKVEPNTTYTITRQVGQYRWIIGYTKDKIGITDGMDVGYESVIAIINSTSIMSKNFTTTPTTEYIKWYDTNSTDINEHVMINLGNTALPYEPYQNKNVLIPLGDLEYCKIPNSDYKDELYMPSGKNLFDENLTPELYSYNSSGVKVSDSDLCINQTLENIDFSSIYVSFASIVGSAYVRVCEYNSSGTFIKRTLINSNQSLTLDSNTKKLIFSVNASSTKYFANLMINKGNTALPYEPYNDGKWYLKKNILEYVITGNENGLGTHQYGTNSYQLAGVLNFNFDTSKKQVLCNYFKGVSNDERGTGNNIIYTNNATTLVIRNTSFDSLNSFKTWLQEKYSGSNPVKVKYVASTPEYIPLNDTLQEQLTKIHNMLLSYKGQTNISQVNNDLPFEIVASALKDISNL